MWKRVAYLGMLAACGGGDDTDMIDAAPAGGCAGENPGSCPSQDACNAGDCLDIPYFVCDETTGEWEEVICEGVFVDVVGTWTVGQQISTMEGTCPALLPRDPVVLTVDLNGVVTAESPVVVVSGTATAGWESGSLQATVTDDWGGIRPTVEYQLTVDETGTIGGAGMLTVDACSATLLITGSFVPAA